MRVIYTPTFALDFCSQANFLAWVLVSVWTFLFFAAFTFRVFSFAQNPENVKIHGDREENSCASLQIDPAFHKYQQRHEMFSCANGCDGNKELLLFISAATRTDIFVSQYLKSWLISFVGATSYGYRRIVSWYKHHEGEISSIDMRHWGVSFVLFLITAIMCKNPCWCDYIFFPFCSLCQWNFPMQSVGFFQHQLLHVLSRTKKFKKKENSL